VFRAVKQSDPKLDHDAILLFKLVVEGDFNKTMQSRIKTPLCISLPERCSSLVQVSKVAGNLVLANALARARQPVLPDLHACTGMLNLCETKVASRPRHAMILKKNYGSG
jgi:hypothetical protein